MKDKRRSLTSSNCVTTASSCIKWDGPEIPCLDICAGDELNDFLHALASKICAVTGINDFSTLSLQCLVDKLNVVIPTERTLINLLQLAFDNDCKLKDLIDALDARIPNLNGVLTLNLACLQVLDGFGNPIPVTQATLNQTLITSYCALKTSVLGLQGSIINLQTQINNINVTPYVEPVISTCLLPSLSLSQQIIQGFALICARNTAIGSIADMQKAVAGIGAIQLNYIANPDWQLNANNLAKSDTNQWVVIHSLLTRISSLEDCACKFTCKDVTIGFTTTFNDDKTVTLKFTTGAGTSIPLGFTNCGSTVTIKNDKNVSTLAIPIVVAQEQDTINIDISMFEGGEYLTFNLDVQLCSAAFNCAKCVTKVVRNTSGCCLITNTGIENVTIIYKICGLPA